MLNVNVLKFMLSNL